jgi:hypothetical protein
MTATQWAGVGEVPIDERRGRRRLGEAERSEQCAPEHRFGHGNHLSRPTERTQGGRVPRLRRRSTSSSRGGRLAAPAARQSSRANMHVRVRVTGATGFIGRKVVAELAPHERNVPAGLTVEDYRRRGLLRRG